MARILSLVTQHALKFTFWCPQNLKFSPGKLDPPIELEVDGGEGRVIHPSNPVLESYTVPNKAIYNNSDVTS